MQEFVSLWHHSDYTGKRWTVWKSVSFGSFSAPNLCFIQSFQTFPRETFLRIFISWQFTFYTPASLQQFPSFSKEKLEIKIYTSSGVDVLLQCWEQEYSLIWRFSFETSHTEKSLIAAVVPDIRVGKCKDFFDTKSDLSPSKDLSLLLIVRWKMEGFAFFCLNSNLLVY